MKKILLLPLLFVLFTTTVLAASTDPEPTVASASAIQNDINKRIKEALDKKLKNTQEVLSENDNRLVGYAGTISDIKQGVFTLNSLDGTLQVSYATSAAIIKDNLPIKPDLLSIKDKVVVIGNLSASDVISAKRIVISKTTNVDTKVTVFSPVIKIKGTTITLKVDSQNVDVVLDKKLKLDIKTLTTNNKIFGIIEMSPSPTLIQAKIF